MRPSSIRTGTSTWTSRNGCIRTCRMYCSRLIRLAARSNWLATMDFPYIVRDDWPVAVTAPPLKSGDFETAARQPTRRVEGFGQGVPGVDLAGATPAGVGKYADHVGARAGRLGGLLEHEHQATGVLRDGAGDGAPPRVRWLRPLGHDDLAEAPPRIARQVEERGRERGVVRGVARVGGREHHRTGLGEPAFRRGQLVRAARRVKRVAAGRGDLPLGDARCSRCSAACAAPSYATS